jgi:predicted pyridoxine 5'-phosphate oxidase superfamily flavin-nucleotide-binding protein
MEKHIKQFILTADSKALGTISSEGIINVVPVSSIKVINEKIVLVNYFMDKTLENIKSNNQVSLVVWSKMIGYQIKGTVEYLTNGSVFDEIVLWIRETIPSRRLS